MRISDWSSDVCSSDLLETSLHFFRGARSQYEEAFAALAARGIHRIALVGSGELAEIALLSASSAGVTVVAIIAPERNIASFHGRPIVPDLASARTLTAAAVATADRPQTPTVSDSPPRTTPTDPIVNPPLLPLANPQP